MIGHPLVAESWQSCGACPEQYEGRLTDGRHFYFRLRHGLAQLGVGHTVDAAVRSTVGASRVETAVDTQGGGAFDSTAQRDDVFAELLERWTAAEAAPDVTDPQTRRPRLLAAMCGTCVFRPGNLMHLRPGRLADLVRTTLARDSFIVCHSTLPGLAPAGYAPAICRGFADRYSTNALRVMGRLRAFVEVTPPEAGHVA